MLTKMKNIKGLTSYKCNVRNSELLSGSHQIMSLVTGLAWSAGWILHLCKYEKFYSRTEKLQLTQLPNTRLQNAHWHNLGYGPLQSSCGQIAILWPVCQGAHWNELGLWAKPPLYDLFLRSTIHTPVTQTKECPSQTDWRGSWGLTRSVWLSSCEIQVSNRCRFPLLKAKSRAQGWGTRQSQDVLVTCYYCVWCKINYAVDFTSDLFWVILVEFQGYTR